jgi:hypothetical protein
MTTQQLAQAQLIAQQCLTDKFLYVAFAFYLNFVYYQSSNEGLL